MKYGNLIRVVSRDDKKAKIDVEVRTLTNK